MKDVIQEKWEYVIGKINDLTVEKPEFASELTEIHAAVNSAFNALSVETDFLIARIEGDAGLIERAAEKLPNVGDMLRRQSQILKNYAARLKDSIAQISNVEEKRIITLPGINGS